MVRRLLCLPLFGLSLLVCFAAAEPNRLERHVAQLGSADPEVRVAARTTLMSLHTQHLPALAAAASTQPTLNLNQRNALRLVVDHVVIADRVNQMGGVGGFLGISIPPVALGDGVLVGGCHPGFPAFQHLRPGDVIIAINANFRIPINHRLDLINAIGRLDPGDFVTLEVRRGLEIKRIGLRLAPNLIPLHGEQAIDEQIRTARPVADTIWAEHFAALFPDEQVAAID